MGSGTQRSSPAKRAFLPNFASPSSFNQVNANVSYIPADTRWPYVQSWFFSVQQQLAKDTILELAYNGNHSLRLPILAITTRRSRTLPAERSVFSNAGRFRTSARSLGWIPPGSATTTASRRGFEHRFSAGLYFLNSFTWSKALGNSEQALETAPGVGLANPQNIRNLAAERGPSSFDVKYVNVTSVVYQLPFGKGRAFGSQLEWPHELDSGRMGTEHDQHLEHRASDQRVLHARAANDVTGRIPDYRGEAIMRPNLVGDPTGSSGAAMLDNYFNKSAFAVPVRSAPFGNLGRNAFRLRISRSGISP